MLIVPPLIFIPKPYQSKEVGKVAFAHKTTLAPLYIVLNVPFGNFRIPPHVYVDILATESDALLALSFVIAI